MEILKMHGLGNSQIIVKDLEENLEKKTGLDYSKIAKALCNPNFGIGSDQMLVLLPSQKADYRMKIFNRDGGEAEMCGNGIRCMGRYLYDEGKVGKRTTIETEAGVKKLVLVEENGEVNLEVNMGKGRLLEENKAALGLEGHFVSVGNPHFVIFTDEASKEMATKKGPELEQAEEFQPEQTNVEFARVTSPGEIETYVWERGAGLTLACGTGACATAFAARKEGLIDTETRIKLLGGKLEVKVDDEDQIWMKGPAEYIMKGKIFDISKIYSNVDRVE